MTATTIKRTAIELWTAYAPKRKRTGQFPCGITLAASGDVATISRQPGVVRFHNATGVVIAAYNDDGVVRLLD